MQSLIDYNLLFFGGKGGVGKTSCAAASALYAALKGKKTLILSTDPAHSLSDSFEKKIDKDITNLAENLDALELNSEVLLQEYKKKNGDLIKQIADEGTFFSKEDIQKFFDLSLPGMDELMALIEVLDILEEKKYDLLILDTAPTGHTIRLLESPELMSSYVNVLMSMRQKHRVVVKMMVGRYVKDNADKFIEKMQLDVERIRKILSDSSKTVFVPVMIPEAMSIIETEKLVNVLKNNKISIGKILINNVLNGECEFCKIKNQEQKKYIKDIRDKFSRFEIKEIPLFPHDISGKSLEVLSKILFDEKYEIPKPKIKSHSYDFKFDSLKVKPNLEFLLFGGKGGVGKTSIASAVALKESENKKILIFSTDPAHSLSDSYNKKIGDSIVNINKNLYALEIDSYKLLDNLKAQYKNEISGFFKSVFKQRGKATIDAPYDRKVMENLFDLAPPGIDEIMALKTMMDLMQDKKYDLFILDTAPTGHAIKLLEMPEIAEEWVSTLLDIQNKYPISFDIGETLTQMLETIKKIRKILTDPKKTEFIPIVIPEEMSYLETQDLLNSLKKLKISVNYLVINKITPKSNCGFCSARLANEVESIKKFQEFKVKTLGINLFGNEIRGEKSLMELGKQLYGK
jgi:arsenite/tail-anchored protein-transporting ATPase